MSDMDPHVRYGEEIERLEAEIDRLRAEADKFGETLVALRKKYRGESDRLRSLLTAPPTDAEWSQFIWDERRNGLRWAMDHFVERRARKIGGDTDE